MTKGKQSPKIRQDCICSHTKTSHALIQKFKDRKVIFSDRGRCLVPNCGCKKYKRKED